MGVAADFGLYGINRLVVGLGIGAVGTKQFVEFHLFSAFHGHRAFNHVALGKLQLHSVVVDSSLAAVGGSYLAKRVFQTRQVVGTQCVGHGSSSLLLGFFHLRYGILLALCGQLSLAGLVDVHEAENHGAHQQHSYDSVFVHCL